MTTTHNEPIPIRMLIDTVMLSIQDAIKRPLSCQGQTTQLAIVVAGWILKRAVRTSLGSTRLRRCRGRSHDAATGTVDLVQQVLGNFLEAVVAHSLSRFYWDF